MDKKENGGAKNQVRNYRLQCSDFSSFHLFVLFLLAALVLFSRLATPAFMDHEGRYAEVAREMLLTKDWITPHLNFTPFLNKPPLPYWLTALIFLFTGPSEYARLWPAVTGLLLLVVVVFLGQMIGGKRAGLYAGVVMLTSGGFFLESRLLRPDLLLTVLLCASLSCFLQAVRAHDSFQAKERDWWIALGSAGLGVSLMTKGMVNVVLAGGIVGGVLLCCRQLLFLRRINWLPAAMVVLIVVTPWHILAGLRNEGFWWDYIVNQHFLFFFDKKFPRDSLPDSLPNFWGAFLGRAFPWSVCLPAAFFWAAKKAWIERSPSSLLLPMWLVVTLGFFSFSPARLEHYTIPAVPAAALLVGCWWSHLSETASPRSWEVMIAIALLCCSGLAGLFFAPSLLKAEEWTQEFPVLVQLLRLVCGVTLVAGSLAGVLCWRGLPRMAVAVFAVVSLPLFFSIHRALTAIEPINSWKPVGEKLAEILPVDGEAIFAASDEYQICGGLNFYSKKPLSILLPDGYIPPTYLTLNGHGSFLTMSEFLQRWRSERPVVLIIDPEREDAESIFSMLSSFVEIGRSGERRMLGNQAFAERVNLMADSDHDTDFFTP